MRSASKDTTMDAINSGMPIAASAVWDDRPATPSLPHWFTSSGSQMKPPGFPGGGTFLLRA